MFIFQHKNLNDQTSFNNFCGKSLKSQDLLV